MTFHGPWVKAEVTRVSDGSSVVPTAPDGDLVRVNCRVHGLLHPGTRVGRRFCSLPGSTLFEIRWVTQPGVLRPYPETQTGRGPEPVRPLALPSLSREEEVREGPGPGGPLWTGSGSDFQLSLI